jgi:branched-chain amino acid transport system substrate-binding protein
MKKLPLLLIFILFGAVLLTACASPAEETTDEPEAIVEEPAADEDAAAAAAAAEAEAAAAAEAEAAAAAEAEAAAAAEAEAAAAEAEAAAAAAEAEAAAAATAEAEAAAEAMRTDNLEGETITFYHFGDLSGPLAGITGPLIHGFEDAVAAINESGGIRGATIELAFSDTQSSVDEAVAAYDRFTSEDDNVLVMFTYGSGDGEALAGRFAEDQIPNLAAGLSSVAFYGPESGYTFGYAPIYPDQFGYFLDWLTANWADAKPASAGDEIKLAYISWPTAYGQAAITEESVAYAESLGVEIVANEIFDPSPTADTTTAILNAQAAGANVIYTNSLAFGPAAILNGLGALGLRGEFFVGANNWAMDLATYAFLSDPALAVGLTTPFPYLWWTDADHPAIQYAEAVFAANERPAAEHGVGYLLTLGGVDIAVTAIENAIDTVGFDNLTGEAVYQALIALGEVDVLDGLMKVDFSETSRSPHQSQLRQIQGGPDAFVILQDWTATPNLTPVDNFFSD